PMLVVLRPVMALRWTTKKQVQFRTASPALFNSAGFLFFRRLLRRRFLRAAFFRRTGFLARPFLRNLRACFPRLAQSNRDRLLPALNALAAAARFQIMMLVFMHHFLHLAFGSAFRFRTRSR